MSLAQLCALRLAHVVLGKIELKRASWKLLKPVEAILERQSAYCCYRRKLSMFFSTAFLATGRFKNDPGLCSPPGQPHHWHHPKWLGKAAHEAPSNTSAPGLTIVLPYRHRPS
mmetsp:Transcript_42401/g.113451  ORF Transcript_42401/g.113451 Transcript_42401/m.113451 type:complete len:113 (+) Transcript_42401:1396-1734(+)